MKNEDNKPVEIVFAPGCFDSFEGTQEELDEFIASIHQMVESGEIFEKARAIDFDNPTEDDLEAIKHLTSFDADTANRKLQ